MVFFIEPSVTKRLSEATQGGLSENASNEMAFRAENRSEEEARPERTGSARQQEAQRTFASATRLNDLEAAGSDTVGQLKNRANTRGGMDRTSKRVRKSIVLNSRSKAGGPQMRAPKAR